MKRVLVLGGGIGGLVTAYNVAKKLYPEEGEVVMVDRTGYHLFMPSLPWVATGIREPRDIMRPLKLLEKKRIKVLVDEVKLIKPEDHTVITGTTKLNYDYLVVSLGSIAREDLIPSKDPNVCTPWTTDGAMNCRKLLRNFKKGTVLITPVSWPYKCPPAPFEVAFLVKYIMEQRKATDVKVKVAHFWKVPMEPFGPMIQGGFKRMLDQFGIEFIGGVEVERFEEGTLHTKGGEKIKYDIAITVPPHLPPEPIMESGLSNPQAFNFMKIDKRSLKLPGYDNVYGIGDVIAPSLGIGMGGVFAHFQGEHVADAIVDDIRGSYLGSDYNKGGMCIADLGYMGTVAYCDFTKRIYEGTFPDCVMLGGGKAFRVLKFAFEKFWLTKFF
ncbi:MAG: FAD/NAD(P)-binding oxidoreductase [Acidilobaceae archaeon]